MRIVASCLVTGLLIGIAQPAYADPLTCQRSILKESTKLARARIKQLQKCEDRKLKGALPGATECSTEPTTAAKIAKAESKLLAHLDRSCGGPDRTCGTDDDEPLAGIGALSSCPDFQELGCTNPIAGCDDIAECLVCIDRAAIDQATALSYADLTPSPDAGLLKCQRTIGSQMRRLFDTRADALRKCWDARYKGGHANECPSPGDGKAEAKIAKAVSKVRAKICKACGGADRDCGGGDDRAPSEIGFPPTCPDVDDCAGVVDTLDGLIDCASCVTGFDGSCTNANAVTALTAFPAACALLPVGGEVLLHLDGTADPLDLDMGWTGFAHDLAAPWIGRLTLAGNDCAGDGNPTFGECTLSGPVRNDDDPSFSEKRCVDQPWIQCANDAQCTAGDSCRFFLGPPQPIGVGGVTSCVLTEFSGPITGTLDVEAGFIETSMPITARLHIGSGGPLIADPCPSCVASTCDAGPRLGMPCTVDGTSVAFGDDVSLDCPPDGIPHTLIQVTLPLATSALPVTLTAASPACTAFGSGALSCFCDTCASAAGEPCFSDADCPGAGVGSCGGLRCLGGPANGTPCSTVGAGDPACGGALCGTIGEPSRPNACDGGICNPTIGNEGECTAGPFDILCGPTETFRGCLADSDCPASGDSCAASRRECFVDNGVIGQSVVATGSADPPINGVLAPVLAGTFCVPPASSSPVNSARGLPGLGRVTAAVTATIE